MPFDSFDTQPVAARPAEKPFCAMSDDERVDFMLEQSFPCSDPPYYGGFRKAPDDMSP